MGTPPPPRPPESRVRSYQPTPPKPKIITPVWRSPCKGWGIRLRRWLPCWRRQGQLRVTALSTEPMSHVAPSPSLAQAIELAITKADPENRSDVFLGILDWLDKLADDIAPEGVRKSPGSAGTLRGMDKEVEIHVG